jgi:hypothetical protein
MRQTLCAVLFACFLVELVGCSTIKWMYSDKTTGEMWWIKRNPLGSDEINYCQPQTGTPVQCGPAELLTYPPAAWAAAPTKPRTAAYAVSYSSELGPMPGTAESADH